MGMQELLRGRSGRFQGRRRLVEAAEAERKLAEEQEQGERQAVRVQQFNQLSFRSRSVPTRDATLLPCWECGGGHPLLSRGWAVMGNRVREAHVMSN